MTYIDETNASLRLLAHTYKMVRDRLERPCNAVPDQPINLKGRLAKQGFRPWPYEKAPEPVKPAPEPVPQFPALETTVILMPLPPATDEGPREGRFPPLFAKHIKRAVAAKFNVSIYDLDCARRTTHYIIPRHVAIYLCQKLTLLSYPSIGRLFGGRDHATIYHAVRKMPFRMWADPALKQTVTDLRQSLELDLERWRKHTP